MDTICGPTNPVGIKYPFGVVANYFFCPACGAQILGEEEHEPCGHILYTFLDFVGEPMWIHPDLEAALSVEEDFLDGVQRTLVPSQTALHVALATGGMACGPTWSTITVGLDLQGAEASLPPSSSVA